MAKRTFDPAWMTHPRFQNLTPLAEVIMYRAYGAADDLGRLAQATLRGTLFPTGERFEADQWHKAQLELQGAGIFCSYLSGGEAVIQIMFWNQPAGRSRSRFDDPPADLASRVVRPAAKVMALAEVPDMNDEVVVWMPVVGGTKEPIRESLIGPWIEAFPAVDVRQELKKMVAWCMAKPERVKTARGVPAFIFGWLSREQNSGSALGLGGSGRHVGHGHLGAAKASIYG